MSATESASGADLPALSGEIGMDARTALRAVRSLVRSANGRGQLWILDLARRRPALMPRIVAAGGETSSIGHIVATR